MKLARDFKRPYNLKRELIVFFLVACAISWSAMFLWNVPKNLEENPAQAVPDALNRVSFFFGFGPFLSAIGTTLFFHGRSGVKTLFKPVLQWRVKWIWYFWALTTPIIAQWLALGLYCLWTGNFVMPPLVGTIKIWLTATPLIAIFSLTEELGWRGFALPRFQKFYNALWSGLILGCLWSFWHYPLEVAVLRGNQEPATNIFWSLLFFTLLITFFSILMTWIFNNSRGSLLLMMLMHGSGNASLINILTTIDPNGRYILSFRVFYAISLLLLVSLVMLKSGGAFFSKSNQIVFKSPGDDAK